MIVAARHERWWRRDLADLPRRTWSCSFEQGHRRRRPAPLLSIVGRDPHAHVVLVPSDHHVERATCSPRRCAGLRVRPRAPTRDRPLRNAPSGPGDRVWVDRAEREGRGRHARRRRSSRSPRLRRRRACSSKARVGTASLLTASAKTLLARYHEHMPELLDELVHATHESSGCARGSLREARDARLRATSCRWSRGDLWVPPVPACGWTDLGTPGTRRGLRRRCPL